MQIQIIENVEIGNVRVTNIEPKKVEGTLFCTDCGQEYNKDDNKNIIKCPVCDSIEYIEGELADNLAGYLKLHRDGTLKKYYKEKYGRGSLLKMSNKRIILWTLIKERLVRPEDKQMENILNRIMWKNF